MTGCIVCARTRKLGVPSDSSPVNYISSPFKVDSPSHHELSLMNCPCRFVSSLFSELSISNRIQEWLHSWLRPVSSMENNYDIFLFSSYYGFANLWGVMILTQIGHQLYRQMPT